MAEAGIAVGIAVGVAIFLFLLWMLSVPICGAPRPVSTVFALLARSIKKRKKWGYTVVDGGRIVLGSVPRSHEHLLELRRGHNVRAVITLNQAWEPQVNGGVARACAQCDIEHLGLPTPDFAAPSQRDIRRAVEFMSAQIAAGGAVYVHCNGGKGRSAVCVLAYLVRTQKLSAHEAYAQVAAQRKIARLLERPLGIPRPQWRALRLYEESVRVEGDLAGAAAAMEEGVGADTALPPPPRAKIKASQVAPL